MTEKIENLVARAKRETGESSLSFAEKTFSGDEESERIFRRLESKLLNIDEWNKHALLSSYELFEENGNARQDRNLSIGTFVRISLKGSLKYDWIRVADICEAADEFIITVKPTHNPTAETGDEKIISHFFTDESTNNFCLSKKGKLIAFHVVGLHEKQNTGETKNMLETIRNVAVNLGSYIGIQKAEWEKFCHGFLEDAEKETGEADYLKEKSK